jgi:Domain of unknown function (DUF4062)/NACHT domain
MPQVSKTFRIFVSSTFGDLRAERNALQEHVFPRLRELCLRHGFRFQAIDLRWGVRDEAALDQQTMKICLEEIHRCQKAQLKPNFIVLLGDRYGWQPLPAELPADEFEEIRCNVKEPDELSLLMSWYRLDENAAHKRDGGEPQSGYCLQPRTKELVDFNNWSAVEFELRSIISKAVKGLALSDEQRLKYFSSATEQEIVEGAITVADAGEHVFAFVREITNLDGLLEDLEANEEARSFVDLDQNGRYDQEAHDKIDALKSNLVTLLGHNVRHYETRWEDSSIGTNHIGTLPDSLDECLKLTGTSPEVEGPSTLCVDVWKTLSQRIIAELARLDEEAPLEREVREHELFGEGLLRLKRTESGATTTFVGRVNALRSVDDYLMREDGSPLVITGESGCGKSSLMAKAAFDSKTRAANCVIVSRFIGATPESSEGRALLSNLCNQIAHAYNATPSELPPDYKGLVAAFQDHLAMATRTRPLFVFIDALDQLPRNDQARNLLWLPSQLPPAVSVVVSTLAGECLSILERKVPEQNRITIEDMPASEGEELLGLLLSEAGRRLQTAQREQVIARFRSCPLPLYLKARIRADQALEIL